MSGVSGRCLVCVEGGLECVVGGLEYVVGVWCVWKVSRRCLGCVEGVCGVWKVSLV